MVGSSLRRRIQSGSRLSAARRHRRRSRGSTWPDNRGRRCIRAAFPSQSQRQAEQSYSSPPPLRAGCTRCWRSRWPGTHPVRSSDRRNRGTALWRHGIRSWSQHRRSTRRIQTRIRRPPPRRANPWLRPDSSRSSRCSRPERSRRCPGRRSPDGKRTPPVQPARRGRGEVRFGFSWHYIRTRRENAPRIPGPAPGLGCRRG